MDINKETYIHKTVDTNKETYVYNRQWTKTRFSPDSGLGNSEKPFKRNPKIYTFGPIFVFLPHIFVCLDNQRAVEITESDGVSSDQDQDVEMNEIEGNINARRTLLR